MTRPDLPRDLPGVPESALPPEIAALLPASTPAPPWDCQVEATIWWHRAAPAARELLPAELPAGLAVTVGAFVRYLSTPVGPYSEVLASPHLVRRRGRELAHVHVPFIAVDSVPSIHGGRVHWGLPKALAAFDGTSAVGSGWSVAALAAPWGPWLPALGRLGSSQVSPTGVVRHAVTTARGRARLARVHVDVTSHGDLPSWLLPGSHRGLVLRGRMVVGPAGQESVTER